MAGNRVNTDSIRPNTLQIDPLEGLAFFNAVAEHGSVTAAALELEMPRSTLSRKVSELEATLGVLLIHRSTRRLTLTAAGEELFGRTRRLLLDAEQARDAVRRLDGVPRGTLRISIPFAYHIVEPVVRRYLERYPETRVEAIASSRMVDLRTEGFDLALRAGLNEDPGLISHLIGETNLFPVASPLYLKARGTPQRPEQLIDHDCLLGVDRHHHPRTEWMTVGGEMVKVSGRLTSNSIELLYLSALEGKGIALLPSVLTATALEEGRLLPVLAEAINIPTPISIVHPYTELVEPRLRAFIEMAMPYLSSTLQEQSSLWTLEG